MLAGALALLWAVVDARPVLAMAVFLVSGYLIMTLLGYVRFGIPPLSPWQAWLSAAAARLAGLVRQAGRPGTG